MSQLILDALRSLNPDEDGQWTKDGLPQLAIIKEMTEDNSITRKLLTELAPQFTRDNMELPDDDVENSTEDDPPETEDNEQPVFNAHAAERVRLGLEDEEETVVYDKGVLEAELAEYNELISKLKKERALLTKKIVETQTKADKTQDLLNAKFPDKSNQVAIMDFIKNEHEKRKKRARERDSVLAKLVQPGTGKTGATPLDDAMARKSNRGVERPKRTMT